MQVTDACAEAHDPASAKSPTNMSQTTLTASSLLALTLDARRSKPRRRHQRYVTILTCS